MSKCVQCGKEYESKRSTSRYCSSKCRKLAFQKNDKVSVPVSVPNLKRGKDIKCFEDLPPDIQRTIIDISESEEEKQRRTGIAIHYQHVFPDRYEPNSDERFTRLMASLPLGSPTYPVSKPGDADYVPMCETTRKWVKEQLAYVEGNE